MSDYPYRAVATLKYRPPPTQGESISFDKGSIVNVLSAADEDGDWLEGENDKGVRGVFPATFVQRVQDEESGEAESASNELKDDAPSAPVDRQSLSEVETPVPVAIEQAAASVSAPTTSPPPPTSPPAVSNAPSQSDAKEAPATSAKATPPPPAKKPNALAARIAAFNQTQQPPTPASAPVPRPKPASKWTVGASTSSTSSSSSTATSPPLVSAQSAADPSSPLSAPAPALAQPETDSSGKPKEFSAEDAKESIGRGGGSLRDRIKALQGLQLDQPAPPGRPPKPWKKKVVEEDEPKEGDATEGDSVVKDREPQRDVEEPVEEERVPGVPSFEPAEPAPADTPAESDVPNVEKQAVQATESSEERQASSPVPASEKPSSIDLLAIAADSTPVVMTPGSASLEVPTSPSPFIPSTDKPPVSPQNEAEAVAGEDDSEAAKKSAIAARMAGLGGQKIGSVPIAALPKKAAGPRRNPRGGSKAPITPTPMTQEVLSTPTPNAREEEQEQPVKPKEVDIEQTGVGEKDEQTVDAADEESTREQTGPKEAEAEAVNPDAEAEPKKTDVFASMGGASSLLRNDDEEEDEEKPEFDDDDFDSPAPPPPSRPAVPPPAPVRPTLEDPELDAGEQQVEEEELAHRRNVVDGEATVGDQAVDTLPTPASADPIVDDEASEADEPETKPQVPLNRPPVPPSFVRQVTDEPPRASSEQRSASQQSEEEAETSFEAQQRSPVVIPADIAGFKLPKEGEAQKPPVPRHPAPPGHEKVTTEAEDRIMNETEVVTPPQEAFDESTAAPELTAPSVLNLAEVRDSHPEASDLSQQALPSPSRKEGELSPPPVASPRPTSPAQERVEDDDEGEEDEEEEEDPEVARRRAIAARMAKLGGMSMRMGPMIPPMGGIPPPKKKTKKPKAEVEEEPARELEARDLNEQGEHFPLVPDLVVDKNIEFDAPLTWSSVVESQSSGNVTPDHPARRLGGIPSGGFALPGIAALRPVHQQDTEEAATNETSESTPDELAATDIVEEGEREEEPAPPPLPAGRPLSMPPRRSVPIPTPEPEPEEVEEDAAVKEDNDEPVPDHAEEFAEEPEQHDTMAPPPPPARPAGGHQDSLFAMSAVPSSPPAPTRPIPAPSKRESTISLGRTTTRSSHRSSTLPTNAASMGFASPRQSLDLAFDAERVQGGGLGQGQFLAKDLDLDVQTGNAWWRTSNGLPRSLQGRSDVAFELLSDVSGSKELEVIYQDYSRTIIAMTFDPEDTTEASTSITQNHFAPPGKPSLDVLLQYSASLGAQIFAAAHLKASDKAARGLTDKQFVEFCFSRATEPVPPIGSTFGAKVYEASSEGKKGPAFQLDDEPRAGDVVVFQDVKLKQTLGSKTIGSHVAIVSGFDDKKSKLRVLEVDKNGASVDEGSYKLDDLKQGAISVYRVLGKDFL
ncbi:hypothetical protein JCM11491_004367 [Sporobolomyces phaffii]